MTSSILYELFDLTVPSPTGIATYARNLSQVAERLGYAVDGLFHTYLALDRKDALLTDIGFFDARNRKPSWFAKYLELPWRRVVGAPTGLRPLRLPRTGVVIDPQNASAGFGRYRNIYTLRLFKDISRNHFMRYGTSATCHLPAKPTIFHATQAIPIRVPGAANIYTIHDIVPLRLPYTTLDDKKFFLRMVRHLGKTADHIVTVSESSKRDLVDICGIPEEKVTNTYQSVSFPEAVLSTSDDEVANHVAGAFELDYRGYYLFYGALEPKKNVGRLIDAHAASGTPFPLVLAGGLGWQYEEDLARIERSGPLAYRVQNNRLLPDQRVRRLGYLPLSQLVALIRGARAILFPSIYEGFGLPILEGMLLGTPVLTSNTASLAEIASNAAYLVDPFDVSDIARGIRDLDRDDYLRDELAKRGKVHAVKFSPEAYRRRVAEVYRE